jgi:trimeric autotransporter adhesin
MMMIGRWLSLLVLLAGWIGTPSAALAQSPELLQLRSGSPATDRMVVDSAGGIVAHGVLGQGVIPATGPGERLMWHPFKGAFRAGSAGAAGSTAWDDADIGFYSWAGGTQTTASAFGSFAFGDQSVASAVGAVAFGSQTVASGTVGFTAGASNECSGFACVAVGYTNRAAGQGSVAIGYRVHASANYSVALGHRAHSGHQGAIVFSDAATTDSIRSTANNQFSARAAGGYRLFTNASLTTGVTMSAGGSSWNVVSDRNRKENVLFLNGEDVLDRLSRVPVTSWNYIEEGKSVRHIGPMAQDWNREFQLNDDPLTINQGDFDGVNLAAIQALEARTAQLQRENAELRDRLDRMERLLEALQPSP